MTSHSSRQATYALLGRTRSDAGGDGPCREGLLVEGGRVRGFGAEARAAAATGAPTFRLPPGWLVQPAFRDPHLHLLGAAAARSAIDCRAEHAPDLESLLDLLAVAASSMRPGTWLRTAGYDEALIADRRAPTLSELDAAVPDHPLALRHRTGHGAVLNTRGAEALRTVDGRRRRPGELIALKRLPPQCPPISPEVMASAMADLSAELARAGVVAVADATENNDRDRLELIADLREGGAIRQDVAFMPGVAQLAEFAVAGLDHGTLHRGISIVHAKIVPGSDDSRLGDIVARARRLGWPVAVHAIDPEQIDLALSALSGPSAGPRDRLEHVSLCLPGQLDAIARAGVDVVSNPAFLISRRTKYVEQLTALERDWLYPIASLRKRGVTVAAASDAPVVAPLPLLGAAGALRRGDVAGSPAAHEAVDAAAAMRMVTHDAARVIGDAGGEGRLELGAKADLVVLDADPLGGERAAGFDSIGVAATFRSGIALYMDERFRGCREAGG